MNTFNISPLDGRYAKQLTELSQRAGGAALTNARVLVETEYLLFLSSLGLVKPKITAAEEKIIWNAFFPLKDADLEIIEAIERKGYQDIPATNHDVKAIEYFIRLKLKNTPLKNRLQWVHYALTSEDVNSLSYALIISNSLEHALLPALQNIKKSLASLAVKHAKTLMLARTHGQAALPTTFGKEIRVFERRLARQLEQLSKAEASCKFGGAAGNFNAHKFSATGVNWPAAAQRFIKIFNGGRKIKITLTKVTTQIDPHDTYAEIFDNLRRINTILLDFSQDMWRYISDAWLKQKVVAGEVGSSAMPQKVNPIDFENAEGNFGMANAMLTYFSEKLPVSRLQRDLSDSTVCRNFGSAFGYCLVAYNSLLKGLGKIEVDKLAMRRALDAHTEVLSEGVQVYLRTLGVTDAYEKLKAFSRGKVINETELHQFIDTLDIKKEEKAKLKTLSVALYTGYAQTLAKENK